MGGHKTIPTDGAHGATVAELTRLGLDGRRRPARALTATHLTRADLVLTFEREHRTEVFQYAPRMLQHCFTLTELTTIARGAPHLLALPLDERIVAASRLRSLGAQASDIPTTWDQPASAHRRASERIVAEVDDLAPFLGLPLPRRTRPGPRGA